MTWLEQVYETLEETKQLSQAAKDAERMGLEKKPGFGLYGKPDDDTATHKSRGGVLRPVMGDEPATGKPTKSPKKPESIISKIANAIIPATPVKKFSLNERPVRMHPSAQIMNTVEAIRTSLQGNAPIEETFSKLTAAYGRSRIPKMSGPGELFELQKFFIGDGPGFVGVYDPSSDTIEVENLSELDAFRNTPIKKWKRNQIHIFGTCIHELLHSTSWRLKMGYAGNSAGLQRAIEEGLTEYLTYHITTTLVGTKLGVSRTSTRGSYPQEVGAIELMAEYGNLQVDNAFKNDKIDKSGNYELDKLVFEAQQRTVISLMYETELFSSEYVTLILERMKMEWENDVLSLANPEFSRMLQYISYNKSIPPKIVTQIQQTISTALGLSPDEIVEFIQKTPKKPNSFLGENRGKKDVEERSIWRTYTRDTGFGARNTLGQVRYFNDRESAVKFASGTVPGPKIGRPKPKKRAERRKKIQKYDVMPVIKN